MNVSHDLVRLYDKGSDICDICQRWISFACNVHYHANLSSWGFFSIFQLFSLPKLRAQVYFFPRNIIFIRHPDLHEDFVINAVVVDVLKSNNSEDWMVWLFRNITIIMI